MISGDEDRLRRLLAGPEMAWVVERVRTRLSRGQPLSGTIVRSGATEDERVAVGRLLGRSISAGSSVSLTLERLDEVLRTSGVWPEGLGSAVIALTGPVEDPLEREAEQEVWRAVQAELDDLAVRHPGLGVWVAGLRASGRVRRVTETADEALTLVRELRTVVDALPAEGESLAGFSARVLHRAHALDSDTPLGGLATAAAEVVGGGSVSATSSAAWRRDAWASVGVLVDDLSSTVLVLGLPGGASSPTARALATLRGAGQPVVLTLRQVVADDVGAVPSVVSVCENPTVVSTAADRLGRVAGPLVCVQGQPGSAAIALLQRLSESGAVLRYHGDFDWGGVSIARTLADRVRWVPWRFGAAEYVEAVRRHTSAGQLAELRGSAADTPWDPSLSKEMTRHGVRVEEELVLDALNDDLRP